MILILILVIGTNAVTSKVGAPTAAEEDGDAAMGETGGGVVEQKRRISHMPSMAFDQLRSFDLSRFATPAAELAMASMMDLG